MQSELWQKAGSLVAFSTGEYSDYSMGGMFVVLEDITTEAVADLEEETKSAYAAAEEAQSEAFERWHSTPKTEQGDPPPTVGSIHGFFIAAMIRKGWLASITYTERHIGSYGELDVGVV